MSGEKTEQPTAKKLRDARKKGQVAKSQEIVSSALILALIAVLFAFADYYMSHISALLLLPSELAYQGFQDALIDVAIAIAKEMAYLLAPIILVAALIAIFSNMGQFGFLFSGESIKPDIKKINPVEGAKRIFSLKSVIEFIKSILKVSLLSCIIWVTLRGNINTLMQIPTCGLECVPAVTGVMIKQLMIISSVGFVVIAAADFAYQKFDHTKKLKMSKDEVKREYKEMEGSPEIKSKRRQLHQELQASNQRENVKRSNVLVTNPTHIAVGLYYKKGETPLPVITLMETDAMAKRMIAIAREEGVPVMQKVPLARALYADGNVDQYIPSELIEATAEVLRWLVSLESDGTQR
ncbi:SctU family type III secretion system export apparatus subunit VscU [Vibrio parahaemolyticus]|uniref:SctU family type III secretion system export apparatus subunit VscU n=1 Tax=Vibrio parahaemolyticus TaxID=670 RepID=UPI001A8EEBCD|nr:SctU family type III secretion system export apparatus subunit VscU [Vibrio parahaemolyticus]MBO0168346.1 SctU family type III secretion system export apparatus subunit VscU [Vibrio parahaemolyticus]MDF4754101.1 SctU family type III secretion system export apparatus subunit VscU [Vibrio parahaemolyticus]MDF4780199.1 SctU family type III secretion system export apparatus subunit VscU [Vibrio parahaemolyticus]MDF4784726.1 SctU family type III secretion system export apparatus subunit VscU [Vib